MKTPTNQTNNSKSKSLISDKTKFLRIIGENNSHKSTASYYYTIASASVTHP